MAFSFGGGTEAPTFGSSPGAGFGFGAPVTFDSPSAPSTPNPATSTPNSSGFGAVPNATFGSASTTSSGFGGGFGGSSNSSSSGSSGFGGGFGASDGNAIQPMFGTGDASSKTPTPAAAANKITPAKSSPKGGDDEQVDDSQLILPVLKGGAFSATVAVKTGEEQEEAVCSERSKMYIFCKEEFGVRTNQWKDFGTGQLKVLKHKLTGKFRLLMRQERTLKVICNTPITGTEQFTYAPNGKQLTLIVNDYDSEGCRYTAKTVAFKVRGRRELEAFKAAFKSASGILILRRY